jgi:hypothetical protein
MGRSEEPSPLPSPWVQGEGEDGWRLERLVRGRWNIELFAAADERQRARSPSGRG